MSQTPWSDRVRQLRARAGLSGVPVPALAALALVAAAVALGAIVLWARPRESAFEVVGDAETPIAESAAEDVASLEPTTSIVVHVVGAVRHPGVYAVTGGSRVRDAVDAGGGFLPNAAVSAQNLARVIDDGEQIVIPTLDEWDGNGTPAIGLDGSPSGAASGAAVDINHASVDQLDSLPGIGPSTAAKIVADRESNGPFQAPEDLMRVAGIGPKKFDALKDLIVAH